MGLSVHLDSNTAIGILNDREDFSGRYKQLRLRGERVYASSIVVFELHYGNARSARVAENTKSLHLFLDTLDGVLPFGADDAAVAGDIRATLRKAGTPIGPYDILIAAQAVRASATLVTANTREFGRVPGLACEDWTQSGSRTRP